MDCFFYNTDARAISDNPKPRFRVLINQGFAAVGGDRERFGKQFDQLAEGDMLLMYENGVGVVAVGRVEESWDQASYEEPLYYTAAEMAKLTGGPHEYRIAVRWFLDLSHSPIGVEAIRNRIGYTPRGAVRRIVEQRDTVESIVEQLLSAPSLLPEEIAAPSEYSEGTCRQVSVNAYERNPEARTRCLQHYGTTCSICGFDFGRAYGPKAEGYIHVQRVAMAGCFCYGHPWLLILDRERHCLTSKQWHPSWLPRVMLDSHHPCRTPASSMAIASVR